MKKQKQIWAAVMIAVTLVVVVLGIAGFVVPFMADEEAFRESFNSILPLLKFDQDGLAGTASALAWVYAGALYLLLLCLIVLFVLALVQKQRFRLIPTGTLFLALVFFGIIGALSVIYLNIAANTTAILLLVFSGVILLCGVTSIALYGLLKAENPDPIIPDASDDTLLEETAPEEESKPVLASVVVRPEDKVAPPSEEEKKPAPANDAPVEEEKKEEPEAVPSEEPPITKKETKTNGKYEVFPEAGFFKYRLKANNGEILLVSAGYKTRDGAKNGIATLKKNLSADCGRIKVDKNGYAQFHIFTANESRLIVAGEIYQNYQLAQSALDSVKKFGKARRIVDLEEIPEEELREWRVDFGPVTPLQKGKFEVFVDEESKKWKGRLVASNGATLLVTANYSSKNSVLNAFENIKSKVLGDSISIAKDKQNRYQFRVYSDNGSIMVMGETYPSRDGAFSAATSVRNFIGDAKIVDLTKNA